MSPHPTHTYKRTARLLHVLQVQTPIHVCASEREGFGHYINEGRAAGAFIISTDHPPMSELVTPGVCVCVCVMWLGPDAWDSWSALNPVFHPPTTSSARHQPTTLTPFVSTRTRRPDRHAATGLRVAPERTSSYQEMALARLAHINAFLNASQLCAAADAVLRMPMQVRGTAGACCFPSICCIYCWF
jgi:hypothetical protein